MNSRNQGPGQRDRNGFRLEMGNRQARRKAAARMSKWRRQLKAAARKMHAHQEGPEDEGQTQ